MLQSLGSQRVVHDLAREQQEQKQKRGIIVLCTWNSYAVLWVVCTQFKEAREDFAGVLAVKNLPARAGGVSLIPGPGTLHMPWTSS